MLLVKRNLVIKITNTQLVFTCPKSTTETLEQVPTTPKANTYIHTHTHIHIYNRQPQTHPTHCSSASIVNLQHPVASWVFTVKTNIEKLSKCHKQ